MKRLDIASTRLRITNQRSSLVANNVLASFAIQGAALTLALFTLPAYIRFFDNQVILGVWFTVLSVVSWILNLDLGVGNGLRNRLVTALAESDRTNARKYISSAYLLVLALVLALSVGVGIAFPLLNWNSILGVPEEEISRSVLTDAVIFTTVGILIQFLLRLIVSILYALQKSAVTGLLNLATSAGMLTVVLTIGPGSDEEKLLLLSKATVLMVNVPLIVASAVVFSTSLRDCYPRFRFFDRVHAADVTKVGGKFFLLQVLFMFIANTDPFLISRLAGPQHVVDYQIYSRFFFLFSTVFVLALNPVWSAVTQAFAQGDLQWIRLLYIRMKRMALLAALGLLALCLALPWLVEVWLGSDSIEVDLGYSLVFAALAFELIWSGILSSIANGIGRLRVQLISYLGGLALKLPVAVLATQYLESWIGVLVASVIALLPYSLAQPMRIGGYLKERARPPASLATR